MDKIKLFCIPYAGGSAAIYTKWKKYLHNDIELCPVELAGRGKRYDVPLYNNFHEAVDDLVYSIRNNLSGRYALFGHSMGSWLTLELTRKLNELGYNEPIHIFFSGNRAPHIYREEKILHRLPDDEFKEEILKIGGTPKEFFENKELLDYFIPVLRADHRIIENYFFEKSDNLLNCNITVLNGINDDFTDNEIEGWRELTKFKCNIFNIKGGHFFINEEIPEVTKIINSLLTKNEDLEIK